MLNLRQSILLRNSFIDVRFLSKKLIKSKIDYSLVPKLDEKDLDETFTHGSGPGGSKVNKSENCVVLVHKPTGIVVKNHEFRELERNRKRARELMVTKLDNFINGDRSVEAQIRAVEDEIRIKKEAEAAKRRELKRKVKELWDKGNPPTEKIHDQMETNTDSTK
ncbi:probable peptide chain release factor C12orf65, mitochondrial [Tetranychus urticae]|uniref:Prokaryotic-type class I peptide chain release factors domain-containing protein n=1 Tax=Tetranychus urticae TaxID=32264 RepID=T1JS25_TETUR|nr:probable peptide chain release factor C12orf65, mitochondrial [Tetranychus urticae]